MSAASSSVGLVSVWPWRPTRSRGAYAAVCHDIYSTQRSILSNDANILCMGALVIGQKTAEELVRLWLPLRFDPSSPSAAKVAQLRQLEEV